MRKKETIKQWASRNGIYLFYLVFILIIVIIGATMNQQAVVKNNGKMPVLTGYELNSDSHFAFQNKQEVNLFWLSDIIEINAFDYQYMISIGDVILLVCLISIFIIAGIMIKEEIKYGR